MNWRLAIVILSVILFAFVIWYRGLRLGLDLRGGSYFLLQVRGDLASQKFVERVAGEILSMYKNRYPDSFTEKSPILYHGPRIFIDAPAEFLDEVKKKFESFEHKGKELVDGVEYDVIELREDDRREIEEFAVSQALEVLRARVDEFGVAEPQIFKQGQSRIVVQLPGLQDPSQAKRLIGRTALLEFRIVDDENDFLGSVMPPEGIYKSADMGRNGVPVTFLWTYDKDYELFENFVSSLSPPAGRKILIGRSERGTDTWRTYIVEDISRLTGEFLRDARVRMNSITNEPYVLVAFNSEGADIFDRLTAENVNRRLAIILDGRVFSAPVIRERISGGVATIEGRFTIQEARELAAVLRAGALPAPVDFEEERTIGPSIGEDSIRKGTIASLLGAVLVFVFMSIYYRVSGLVATVGVIINLLFTFAVLSLFGATLTLPGIAGIALTVGMTVDNNIIIFERIREEILKRLSVKPSVESGYKIGMRTVLDANITTLIAALFIFQFGTGPVRGFALTLSVGILGALYGSVFCARVLLEWLNQRRIFSV